MIFEKMTSQADNEKICCACGKKNCDDHAMCNKCYYIYDVNLGCDCEKLYDYDCEYENECGYCGTVYCNNPKCGYESDYESD